MFSKNNNNKVHPVAAGFALHAPAFGGKLLFLDEELGTSSQTETLTLAGDLEASSQTDTLTLGGELGASSQTDTPPTEHNSDTQKAIAFADAFAKIKRYGDKNSLSRAFTSAPKPDPKHPDIHKEAEFFYRCTQDPLKHLGSFKKLDKNDSSDMALIKSSILFQQMVEYAGKHPREANPYNGESNSLAYHLYEQADRTSRFLKEGLDNGKDFSDHKLETIYHTLTKENGLSDKQAYVVMSAVNGLYEKAGKKLTHSEINRNKAELSKKTSDSSINLTDSGSERSSPSLDAVHKKLAPNSISKLEELRQFGDQETEKTFLKHAAPLYRMKMQEATKTLAQTLEQHSEIKDSSLSKTMQEKERTGVLERLLHTTGEYGHLRFKADDPREPISTAAAFALGGRTTFQFEAPADQAYFELYLLGGDSMDQDGRIYKLDNVTTKADNTKQIAFNQQNYTLSQELRHDKTGYLTVLTPEDPRQQRYAIGKHGKVYSYSGNTDINWSEEPAGVLPAHKIMNPNSSRTTADEALLDKDNFAFSRKSSTHVLDYDETLGRFTEKKSFFAGVEKLFHRTGNDWGINISVGGAGFPKDHSEESLKIRKEFHKNLEQSLKEKGLSKNEIKQTLSEFEKHSDKIISDGTNGHILIHKGKGVLLVGIENSEFGKGEHSILGKVGEGSPFASMKLYSQHKVGEVAAVLQAPKEFGDIIVTLNKERIDSLKHSGSHPLGKLTPEDRVSYLSAPIGQAITDPLAENRKDMELFSKNFKGIAGELVLFDEEIKRFDKNNAKLYTKMKDNIIASHKGDEFTEKVAEEKMMCLLECMNEGKTWKNIGELNKVINSSVAQSLIQATDLEKLPLDVSSQSSSRSSSPTPKEGRASVDFTNGELVKLAKLQSLTQENGTEHNPDLLEHFVRSEMNLVKKAQYVDNSSGNHTPSRTSQDPSFSQEDLQTLEEARKTLTRGGMEASSDTTAAPWQQGIGNQQKGVPTR